SPSTRLTMSSAFEEVQQTSVTALTAAEVLTYVTTGTPGYISRMARTSSTVIESASEQPARLSGMSTVLSGLSSFEVSAMKCTPHCTITCWRTLVASMASCR